jgi:hypothetical protein
LSLTPSKTPTQDHASGEEHAVRLIGDWLAKEGLQSGDKAKELVSALKAGPPRLVILQQGRVEELVEALAKLQAENEVLEADQSARGELEQRLINLAGEALRIADTLLAAKRGSSGNT